MDHDNVGSKSIETSVKLVKMVDGKEVEQAMSPAEQMLAEHLARVYMAARRTWRLYKQARLMLVCSVVANVAMLTLFWLPT